MFISRSEFDAIKEELEKLRLEVADLRDKTNIYHYAETIDSIYYPWRKPKKVSIKLVLEALLKHLCLEWSVESAHETVSLQKAKKN